MIYNAIFLISEIYEFRCDTETACNQRVEILCKCLMYNVAYYYSVLTYRQL